MLETFPSVLSIRLLLCGVDGTDPDTEQMGYTDLFP